LSRPPGKGLLEPTQPCANAMADAFEVSISDRRVVGRRLAQTDAEKIA
jgi:hypothetical protein